MLKADLETDNDGHASSIRWLISSIEGTCHRGPSLDLDEDAESPSAMVVRRVTGVEARWWAAVILFIVVWLFLLYLFGHIADDLSPWPRIRFVVLIIYITSLVYISREFGARFRVLNDRSTRPYETTWAMLCGWLMIGILSVIIEPMKTLASDLKRYDTMTAVALVSWIYLYNAALKLPWDKATEQRKAAHTSWHRLALSIFASLSRLQTQVILNLTSSNDHTLHANYHSQLITWDSSYPGWRPGWQRVASESAIARHGCATLP